MEENFYFYYSSARSKPDVYIPSNNITLKSENKYDYTKIKDEEVIKFYFRLDMDKINRLDFPLLILSDQKENVQYDPDNPCLRIDLAR